jgi:hypothetical protein
MGFWNKIFGGKHNVSSPATADPPTEEQREAAFQSVLDMIKGKSFDEVPWQDVLNRIIGILSEDQGNVKVRDQASWALHGHLDEIDPSVIASPLLDSVFAQCSNCTACWLPDPTLAMGGVGIVTNPTGGKCNRCGLVFCARCYGTSLTCTRCHQPLGAVTNANGRTRPPSGYYDGSFGAVSTPVILSSDRLSSPSPSSVNSTSEDMDTKAKKAFRAYWRSKAQEWWRAQKPSTTHSCDDCGRKITSADTTFLWASDMSCETCTDKFFEKYWMGYTEMDKYELKRALAFYDKT